MSATPNETTKPSTPPPRQKTYYSLSIPSTNNSQNNFIVRKFTIHNHPKEEQSLSCLKEGQLYSTIEERSREEQSAKVIRAKTHRYNMSNLRKERSKNNKLARTGIFSHKKMQQLPTNSASKRSTAKLLAHNCTQPYNISTQQRLQFTRKAVLTPHRTTAIQPPFDEATPHPDHDWRRERGNKLNSASDRRSWNQQGWEEPAWANNDSIEKLIRFVRQSKGRVPESWGIGQIPQVPSNMIKDRKELPPRARTVRARVSESPTLGRKKTEHKEHCSNLAKGGSKYLEPWRLESHEDNGDVGGIEDYEFKSTEKK